MAPGGAISPVAELTAEKSSFSFMQNSNNIITFKKKHSDERDADDDHEHNICLKKIPFSDVVVRPRKRGFWLRKWRPRDLFLSLILVHVHLICFFFGKSTFSWGAFWVAVSLYFITGLAITVSYHRNLAHRSFKVPKWLEYLLAYCAVLAMQGDPIFWASVHRYHHQYVDKEQDPHSPTEGFWFSHILWPFDVGYLLRKTKGFNNVKDLEQQFFYRFLRKTTVIHPFTIAIPLYWFGGFPYLVWGLYIRTMVVHHITFSVNSACHVWGYQTWDTRDSSKNNWWVALLSFGEGWHNNHHAFEFSARHGHEWWQLDLGWCLIKLLERVGLATNVKVPSESQKRRMPLKKENFNATA